MCSKVSIEISTIRERHWQFVCLTPEARVEMFPWQTDSVVSRYADNRDLAGLAEALRAGRVSPPRVKAEIERGLKRKPQSIWRPLFYTVALASGGFATMARDYLRILLDGYQGRENWSDLETDDIIHLIASANATDQQRFLRQLSLQQFVDVEPRLPEEYSICWLEEAFERCRSDAEQLIPLCKRRAGNVKPHNRKRLWHVSRPETILWRVLSGLGLPDLVMDFLPTVMQMEIGQIPWHRLARDELDELLKEIRQHEKTLLPDFVA